MSDCDTPKLTLITQDGEPAKRPDLCPCVELALEFRAETGLSSEIFLRLGKGLDEAALLQLYANLVELDHGVLDQVGEAFTDYGDGFLTL